MIVQAGEDIKIDDVVIVDDDGKMYKDNPP